MFLFVLDVAGCVRVVPIMPILDPVAHRGLDPGQVLEGPIAPLCSRLSRHPRGLGLAGTLWHMLSPACVCHRIG